MSSIYFPFTSVGGDRKVTAFQEAQGFDMFVSSGVVEPSPGDLEDALEVTAAPDAMQVSVAIGKAVILGHRLITDAASSLTLDAGGAQGRIDVIVAESNRNNDVRAARLLVVKGTEGASPSPPALTETDAVYQIPLAWVSVPAGATTLNAATITDKREASRPRGMSSEAITAVQEFPYKKAVRVATTGSNLAALSGLPTIDEVTVEAGDRVLVKDQTDGEDNGIYVAASSAWVRASDFDTDGKSVSQMLIPVEQGTTLGGSIWQLTTESPITLDTTALVFERFDTDDITAGNGLQRVADEISLRTPGNISLTSTNKADGTDHTHALVLPGLTPKQLTLTTANEVAADGHTHDIELPGLTPLTITSATANTVGATGHSHALTIPADMQALTYVYRATGSGDGAAISALVNAFLEATGVWAGTTALTLKLVITGTLGLPATPAFGAGTTGDHYRHFNFASTQTRGAQVEIDWSDARGLEITRSGSYFDIISQSGAGAAVNHRGLSASLAGYGENNIIYLASGSRAVLENCNLLCAYNSYNDFFVAVYATGATALLKNCSIKGYVVASTGGAVMAEGCLVDVSASSGSNFATAYGFLVQGGGELRVSGCLINAYSHYTGEPINNNGSAKAAGIAVSAGKATAVNCTIIAKAECDYEDNVGEAYACQLASQGSAAALILNGCRLVAYLKSGDEGSEAYAVIADSNETGNSLIAIGNSFPTVALSGYEQTGAIKLEGTTTGAAYLIANNVFAGANSSPNIVKHSDNDPADNYQMTGNMFGVNLG